MPRSMSRVRPPSSAPTFKVIMTVENWFPTPVYYNDPARLVMFDGKIRHRATSYRNQPRITIAIKYSA